MSKVVNLLEAKECIVREGFTMSLLLLWIAMVFHGYIVMSASFCCFDKGRKYSTRRGARTFEARCIGEKGRTLAETEAVRDTSLRYIS